MNSVENPDDLPVPKNVSRLQWQRFLSRLAENDRFQGEIIKAGQPVYLVVNGDSFHPIPVGFAHKASRSSVKIRLFSIGHLSDGVVVRWDAPIALEPAAVDVRNEDSAAGSTSDTATSAPQRPPRTPRRTAGHKPRGV